ncbi:MAG: hypothetical protein HY232_13050 [Acidobacteria bacterium]|nr:hypothetical protein [Acidobacteriota bacterium]
MTSTNTKPEKKFRIGALSAAIWKNQTAEGKPFYSVTFERSYRSEDGVKSTDGFNHGDLLNVAQLATRAEAYLAEQTAP